MNPSWPTYIITTPHPLPSPLRHLGNLQLPHKCSVLALTTTVKDFRSKWEEGCITNDDESKCGLSQNWKINNNPSSFSSSAGNRRFGKLQRSQKGTSGAGEDRSNVSGQAANQERRGKAAWDGCWDGLSVIWLMKSSKRVGECEHCGSMVR